MKILILLLMLAPMSRLLGVRELSVRAYLVPSLESLAQMDPAVVIDPFSKPGALPEFSPKGIKRPPFESRFLKVDGELFDVSDFMAARFAGSATEIQAVFESKSRRLVVKTDLETHDLFRRRLEGLHSFQIHTEVTLFSVPGTRLGASPIEKGKATWSSSVSCLHLPGQSVAVKNQEVSLEIESHTDHEGKVIESRFTVEGGQKAALVKTCLWQLDGEDRVVELGSPDGDETLALLVRQDLLLLDGTPFDDWIFLEEGVFNPRERFERVLDYSKEVQVFPAPGFLYLDILPLVEDDEELPDHTTATGPVPFRSNHSDLGGGKWKDLYEVSYILREAGYQLEKGELFLYRPSISRFYAKLGDENLKILERAFKESQPAPPLQFQFELVEVTSDQRLEAKALNNAGLQIDRKICGLVLPGQAGAFQVKEGHEVQMELQEGRGEGLIEGRVTLAGVVPEEPQLQAGFFCQSGVPLIVRQSYDGENWTALVLTVVEERSDR